ncbi:hypothetical protein ACFP2T_16405 [Plantactinospora solaniradicis]|uniref:Uncharacterized protein n=1 Tax=Plantactinospora solaniradicis TaxID=1723736 RepID=A0ABW1K9W5_9ACTN
MRLNDLNNQVNESIRVHHASGHFDREEAMARLTANGLTEVQAKDLLAQPVDVGLFHEYGTYPPEVDVTP